MKRSSDQTEDADVVRLTKAPAKAPGRPLPKVSKSPPVKRAVGRPGGDPKDVRSERLVQKMHPDLMAVFVQRARQAGVTRSAYIERVLLHHARFVEGADLDNIGRRASSSPFNSANSTHERVFSPSNKPPIRWPAEQDD